MTVEQAFERRWKAINPDAEYFHEHGFETAWRQRDNAWWGSPLDASENQLDDGTPIRIFANAIVAWRNGQAEVLG